MAGAAIDDKLIQHITDTIVRHFHPRRIILFGSRARGEARPDSDVDLLAEMESDKTFYERGYELGKLFVLRDWCMDLLVFTPEELAERREWSFLKPIAEECKPLYERSDSA